MIVINPRLTRNRSTPSNLLSTQPSRFYDDLIQPIAQSRSTSSTSNFSLNRTSSEIGNSTPNGLASSSKLDNPKRPPSRTERKFICTHKGCSKAYFKPSRLAEHELTHTGLRPHGCPHCSQTYLRASHLTAHLRTHLSNEDRPFSCTRPGCGKRLWTSTHLKRHEIMHDASEVYSCPRCEETFSKAHNLRDHITLAHMPTGTKPWPCQHPGCEWSFALKQQLKTHEKTHDPTRYTCSHPSHGNEMPNFSVWSALQAHIHEDHPPTCPHEECAGRTFKSTQKLQKHLKVHADRQMDLSLLSSDGERLPAVIEDGLHPLKRGKKRRRSEGSGMEQGEGGKVRKLGRIVEGEVGKHWVCSHSCGKKFKSKYAMETHLKTIHRNQDQSTDQSVLHTCPHSSCSKSYPHLTNLTRHLLSHKESTESAGSILQNTVCIGGLTPNTGRNQGHLPSDVDEDEDEGKRGKGSLVSVGEITGLDFSLGGKGWRRFGCVVHLIDRRPLGVERPRIERRSESEIEAGDGLTFEAEEEVLFRNLQVELDLRGNDAGAGSEADESEPESEWKLRSNGDLGDHRRKDSDDAIQMMSTSTSTSLAQDVTSPNSNRKREQKCLSRFWRVYDLRRHLKSDHGVSLDDMQVRRLILMNGEGR